MPRPAKTGYARIAQEEENRIDDDEDGEEQLSRSAVLSNQISHYEPIRLPSNSMKYAPNAESKSPRTGRRRQQSNSSGVDIKAINTRLERWADEIASKFKRGKGRGRKLQRLEIQHSVFQPPSGLAPAGAGSLEAYDQRLLQNSVSQSEYDSLVERVEAAIDQGVQPKMISQGSSGSYFARDVDGKVVGVFKPKDEEPYAAGNPKWNKWIHRNLFPCFFGRSCLIPNLSYVSEAAAYVLDRQLRSNLVPYTDIVHLASISFHYDYWDRHSYYRRKKPLKPKVGSFQVFLKGFKDANIFLRENPWPDQYTTSAHRNRLRRRGVGGYIQACFTDGSDQPEDDDAADPPSGADVQRGRFFWSDSLQQSFREELEKLVILDYIMRNTDRGLDNWMIRVNWDGDLSSPSRSNGANPSVLSQASSTTGSITMTALDDTYHRTRGAVSVDADDSGSRQKPGPTISIGAIDNSLSWPWKHPDAWRSFPFGWLFLPVSLIGRPFSQKTRDHFLPLLTSTRWWSDTQGALRQVFSQDADFQEKMFAKQIAVMKGQAWNVVETLKTTDHGPLELTRRARVCVWDDQVEVPLPAPAVLPSTSGYARAAEDEEMDISTLTASAPLPQPDRLGSPLRHSSTAGNSPGRSTFARGPDEHQTPTIAEQSDAPMSPLSPVSTRSDDGRVSAVPAHKRHHSDVHRPGPTRAKSRASFDGLPQVGGRRDRGSLSRKRGSSLSLGGRGGYYPYQGDDLEGDIGYAAAADMEKNLKLMIVERLEPVKTRNPVFTWC